jgi:hypothetical protein
VTTHQSFERFLEHENDDTTIACSHAIFHRST